MKITAYMLSCPERLEIRRQTVAGLLASDWNELPVIEVDQATYETKQERIVHTAFRLLQRAITIGSEIIVFLEDDLRFNKYWRYNLEHWYPLVNVQLGHHFFGSLYNPGIRELECHDDRAYFVADPQCVYGSQAFILSLVTAQRIIEYWDRVDGFPDYRMSRLAATVCPIYYHTPSLVQHVGRSSTLGSHYHRSHDFRPDWKAMAY